MEVKLISIDLCSSQREFALDDLPMMIGRCADAGVRLGDPTVSCRHCEIEEKAKSDTLNWMLDVAARIRSPGKTERRNSR